MRQEHRANEKMFIDYAGQTMDVVVPLTGEVSEPQIFVAILSVSNYYIEAMWTQSLPDWIGSHQRASNFLAG
ncbi:hypothetical protein DFAR_2210055 [Desulfarculales bacterium]